MKKETFVKRSVLHPHVYFYDRDKFQTYVLSESGFGERNSSVGAHTIEIKRQPDFLAKPLVH